MRNLSGCGQNRGGERSAVFLRFSICAQNSGVKGPRPSFTSRFVAKTKRRKDRGLPSPLGLWPKPKGERTAAFLHLSVCGQNQKAKGPRPSFTSRFVAKTKRRKDHGLHLSVCGQNQKAKGPRPSFTSRFVAKTKRRKDRGLPSPLGLWPKPKGERTAAFLHLSVCGQNQKAKGPRPSFTSRFVAKTKRRKDRGLPSPLGLWPKQRGERAAAFLHLSVCGQNQKAKGPRPSFTSRFVAKTKRRKDRGLPSPLGLWPKQRGERAAAFLHHSVCGQNREVKGPRPSSFLHLSACGRNRGVKGPRPIVRPVFLSSCVCVLISPFRFSFHPLVSATNREVKEGRAPFTPRFVGKTER